MSVVKPKLKPVGATAFAVVTVEVRGLGSWGPDCSLAQIHRQASEQAIGIIRRCANISVIGTPEIKTVIVEKN